MRERARFLVVGTLLALVVGAAAWWFVFRSEAEPTSDAAAERVAADSATGPALEAAASVGKPRADAKAAPIATAKGTGDGAPPPPTPEHPASLKVRVLGEQRAPLAGAEVDVGTLKASTDAEGIARLPSLTAAKALVSARAKGHLPTDVPVEVTLQAGVEAETEIVLEPARALTGRVLDAQTSAPIGGARVRSRGGGSLEFESASGGRESYGEALTDAQGRFRFETLPVEWIVTLWAEVRGYGRGEICVKLHAEGSEPKPVEIRLPPGGWLTATVRDASNAPVAGATVRMASEEKGDVFVVDGTPDPFDDAAWFATATTDATGQATVLGLPFDKRLCVRAEAPDAANSETREGLVATARDPNLSVDLRLRAAATLVVRLKNAEGLFLPARGITVDGAPPAETVAGTSTTPTMEARFTGLAPGRRRVRVGASGFRPLELDVDLPEGEREDRVLSLDPGAPLQGRVVDDLGKPVPRMTVRAASSEPEEMLSESAGDDGSFLIAGVAGRSYALRAVDGSADHAASAEVEARAPARDLRIVCPRLARVTVRLRAPEGLAVPGEVTVYSSRGDSGWNGTSFPQDGKAVKFPYPPEAKRFRIEVDGFVGIERDLEALPGAEVDLGELLLDPGLTLEGRVVDAAGRGIADVEVHGPTEDGIRTDADGRFRLAHLPREEVGLWVRVDGYVRTTLRIPAADLTAAARIVLQRGGLLSGRVVLAGGSSGGKRYVTCESEKGETEWLQSDADGTFHQRLLPGAWRVAVGGDGATPMTWVSATVIEGEEAKVTVVSPP